MTITRDHVSDLAEKASSDDPRSGKTSPSAATATATAAASRNAESARDSNEVPVVTLATLRSLPENEEVTLYLDVVPAAAPGTKRPKAAQKSKKKAAEASEFEKFLKRPCPDLGGLLHTLEKKIASPPRGRQSSARSEAEEVVATVSQCVIVRKISSCDEGKGGGEGCAIGGKLPKFSTPSMPPPPLAVLPRASKEKKSGVSSKVDATIDACLLGESQTNGENLDHP